MAMSGAITEMAQLEAMAEAAFEQMYEARPPAVKDYYEDAMRYLTDAIEEAERMGSCPDVERLTQRRKHVWDVYNHQFRGIG
jgi:vacuolar-type H+-ATPase subunit H